MEEVFQKLRIESPADWQYVTRKQIVDLGGSGLLDYYGGWANALSLVYPDIEWPRHSNRALHEPGFWDDIESVRRFLNQIRDKHDVQCLSEWHQKVSHQTLLAEGASTGLLRYKGVTGLLKAAYPNHPWSESRKPPGYWKDTASIRVRPLIFNVLIELTVSVPEGFGASPTEIGYTRTRRMVSSFSAPR